MDLSVGEWDLYFVAPDKYSGERSRAHVYICLGSKSKSHADLCKSLSQNFFRESKLKNTVLQFIK